MLDQFYSKLVVIQNGSKLSHN